MAREKTSAPSEQPTERMRGEGEMRRRSGRALLIK
jgi:hypothetical protein